MASVMATYTTRTDRTDIGNEVEDLLVRGGGGILRTRPPGDVIQDELGGGNTVTGYVLSIPAYEVHHKLHGVRGPAQGNVLKDPDDRGLLLRSSFPWWHHYTSVPVARPEIPMTAPLRFWTYSRPLAADAV